VLACIYLMANLSVETWLRFLAWLVIGLLVYALYGRTHSRLRRGGDRTAANDRNRTATRRA
jgi:APA family basic amino acid/polyamine antiporter